MALTVPCDGTLPGEHAAAPRWDMCAELGARVEHTLLPLQSGSFPGSSRWGRLMETSRRLCPAWSVLPCLSDESVLPLTFCPCRSVSPRSLEAAASADLAPCTSPPLSQKRRSQRRQCPGLSAENSSERPTLFLHQ